GPCSAGSWGTPSCAPRPAWRRRGICRTACPWPAARRPAGRSARGSPPPPARPRTSGSSGGRVLDRDHARSRALLGGGQPAHRPPGGLVAEADVADLARLHRLAQYAEHFGERGEGLLRMVLVHQPPERVHRALRPVQLVEVDIVGPEALQAV